MATAHEIAVITNSCVKAPIDPESGLLTTFNERKDASLSNTWQGKSGEYDCNKENLSTFIKTKSQEIGPDLNTLSDAEFYDRLVALKKEHKKTLDLCENLYSAKLSKLREASPVSSNPRNATTVSVSRDFTMSPLHSLEFESNIGMLGTSKSSMKRDNVKDMRSSKPPNGRPKTADLPSRSRSVSKKSAWMTATGSPFSSQEEELFRATTRRSNDIEQFLSGDEHEHFNDSRYSTHSKISEMWENFSVDDYAPHTKPRPRSASLSRATSSRGKANVEKQNQGKEWRHRITIPKPFNMTLRDSNKTPKKTKAMLELEEQRELQERENESECQKKFKAKPVPAHVYMPLYNEIMEEKETKRRIIREHCKEVLKSQETPFKFMKREEEKKKHRRAKSGSLAEYDKKEKVEFKAHPYPSHIFDNTVADKIKEEEEYRKIRMQMRSEELLKTASLPPNMAERGQDYVDGKSRQKMFADRAKKAGFTPEHKFKPKINQDMPDFDELHRQYMKEVAHKKARKEATVCKPFNLRTVNSGRKSKDYNEIERHNNNDIQTWNSNDGTRRSLLFSKTLSTSMDAIPAKLTKATELRMSANKEKLQRKIQSELSELEASRKKRLKEERLKKTINEKAMANDTSVTNMKQRESKLKEFRESDRARQQEYNNHLNEMKQRVNSRPLLFERTAQENAMKAADKRYKETLCRAGLDEDFVNQKGKAASGSVNSENDDGNVSDEESYMRSYSNKHSSSRQSGTRGYSDDYEKESGGDRTQSEGELEEDSA